MYIRIGHLKSLYWVVTTSPISKQYLVTAGDRYSVECREKGTWHISMWDLETFDHDFISRGVPTQRTKRPVWKS